MLYKNVKTGIIIESLTECRGADLIQIESAPIYEEKKPAAEPQVTKTTAKRAKKNERSSK
jgi:hypothetical protein